jgi:hypothetical protein
MMYPGDVYRCPVNNKKLYWEYKDILHARMADYGEPMLIICRVPSMGGVVWFFVLMEHGTYWTRSTSAAA